MQTVSVWTACRAERLPAGDERIRKQQEQRRVGNEPGHQSHLARIGHDGERIERLAERAGHGRADNRHRALTRPAAFLPPLNLPER